MASGSGKIKTGGGKPHLEGTSEAKSRRAKYYANAAKGGNQSKGMRKRNNGKSQVGSGNKAAPVKRKG